MVSTDETARLPQRSDHSLRVLPASAVVAVNGTKNLRAIPRDRAQRLVEDNLDFEWQVVEGEGRLENDMAEIVTFRAPAEPGLSRIRSNADRLI